MLAKTSTAATESHKYGNWTWWSPEALTVISMLSVLQVNQNPAKCKRRLRIPSQSHRTGFVRGKRRNLTSSKRLRSWQCKKNHAVRFSMCWALKAPLCTTKAVWDVRSISGTLCTHARTQQHANVVFGVMLSYFEKTMLHLKLCP